jgi:hypothetical protein
MGAPAAVVLDHVDPVDLADHVPSRLTLLPMIARTLLPMATGLYELGPRPGVQKMTMRDRVRTAIQRLQRNLRRRRSLTGIALFLRRSMC